jgi:hypothetical protein
MAPCQGHWFNYLSFSPLISVVIVWTSLLMEQLSPCCSPLVLKIKRACTSETSETQPNSSGYRHPKIRSVYPRVFCLNLCNSRCDYRCRFWRDKRLYALAQMIRAEHTDHRTIDFGVNVNVTSVWSAWIWNVYLQPGKGKRNLLVKVSKPQQKCNGSTTSIFYLILNLIKTHILAWYCLCLLILKKMYWFPDKIINAWLLRMVCIF